jgi:diguanylate cyclase
VSPGDLADRPRPLERRLTVFLDAMLQILTDVTPEAEPAVMAVFRSSLEQTRARLSQSEAPEDVSVIAMTCVDACENYLKHSRHYHAARETDLLELIAFLRAAAKSLIGGADDFNAQVIASSERLGALDQVGDLRELRVRIANEVSTLKTAADLRQHADRELAATMTRRIETLQSSLLKAEHEAATDPLTQIANRGTFDRELPRLMAEARRLDRPLSLAMFDLDQFKDINDRLGHMIGDRVLLFTAQTLTRGVRGTDLVARHGGDEFVVVLPGANLAQATKRFQALVSRIAAHEYEYTKEPVAKVLQLTVSCGVAEMKADDTPASLIAQADEALLDAKRKGRNRLQSRKGRSGILSRMFSGS